MKVNDEGRLKNLLRQALPPVEGEPGRDLWPAVLRRLDARPASLPWFDWATSNPRAISSSVKSSRML